MADDKAIKEVSEILGNKKKFRRALIIIGIISLVICYGFYSHEISRIITGVFAK